MKGIAAGIGVVVLSPFLLAGTAMLMASSSQAAQTTYSPLGCVDDVDSDAVVEQVTKILNGASAKDVHIEGLSLPEEQIPHAQTIVATGISLDVPKKGQVIALATAMQESRLRNLNSGDRDSLGLFQQRPSQGWGTAEQIRDPVYASERFYKALLAVEGWQQLTVTQAAQAVQRSAYPDAYAQWEPLATALQKAIAATFPDADQNATETETASSTTSCTATEDGPGYGTIPEGAVPKGYSIPKDADPKVRKAIAWAMAQLGTMYQWGGTCTAPHGPDPMGRCDCSSLTQQAYAHIGITLTRTTYTQINEGKAVSPKALKPGDLIFSRGSAARPEHVGMYIGSGLAIEAPRTGKPVRINPLADWVILAARRVI
ncbi:C40 family peptidase [Streptomyces neyagawaensis]|uniref:C40 family peptidase n=1 Tax=Streptomyces neyagawaensis TaxID=42238 RepID=UPI0006E28AAB|nr:C40 family peptidase [Streptomyces neyagawaensis]MCL6737742.1 C40 family peptidase [Streptomyces neyagawaensis]MDE1687733.1 C40 family peptidase [Streptomyces neyagawaensis]MDG5808494.1 C40 family peptidase [Streptomyces ossamyceticus]